MVLSGSILGLFSDHGILLTFFPELREVSLADGEFETLRTPSLKFSPPVKIDV